GQHQVEQDDVRILGLQQLQRPHAVHAHHRVEATDGEVGPDQVHDVGIVLHHQRARLADVLVHRRHRPAPVAPASAAPAPVTPAPVPPAPAAPASAAPAPVAGLRSACRASSASPSTGRYTLKHVPLDSAAGSSMPPCACTMPLAMESPSPAPVLARGRRAGSNGAAASSGGRPRPSSIT